MTHAGVENYIGGEYFLSGGHGRAENCVKVILGRVVSHNLTFRVDQY